MSSVLKAFERFTIEQELQDRGEEGSIPPETLKSAVKVFVINTPNPTTRYQMLNFCLRIICSQNARASHRVGALITLFSLPSAGMQNHIRLADRSPEAQIERCEIDGFEPGTYRLIPNARANLTANEIAAYALLADDLPPTINNGTPYVHADVEGQPCDEIEQFLDRCYSVLIQAWVMVCKCMTAYDQPAGSADRRFAKYQQQGRLEARYMLQPEAQRLIQTAIRKSLVVRQYLTFELQLARRQGLLSNRYYAMVGDIGKYIENSGLTAFFLTLKYALGTKWSPLSLAAFTGELTKLRSLMMLYRDLGEQARYLALLEAPQIMDFAPGGYPLIFSYAMGVGTVLDVQMRNYTYARPFLNGYYFQIGVETARRQQGTVDNRVADDLGLTPEQRTEVTQLVDRLARGRGAGIPGGPVNPFVPPVQQQQPAAVYEDIPALEESDDDGDEDGGAGFQNGAQAPAVRQGGQNDFRAQPLQDPIQAQLFMPLYPQVSNIPNHQNHQINRSGGMEHQDLLRYNENGDSQQDARGEHGNTFPNNPNQNAQSQVGDWDE
uniref:Nucleocapsid n=1 Tax=Mumps virus genotype G TaxID=1384672 RepID=A0A7L9DNG5_MUMPV|nr:nucleocapsid protein [Mumps virus genotype G]QOJ55635.1 nucleocapsid protein [Mumps virus genotype G]QOJ55999.1 nucleocapsid protein [Mumps virus genotype G]